MSNMTPTLGQIMKKARLEQRFTQEEIAERIGCHPQYYKNRGCKKSCVYEL